MVRNPALPSSFSFLAQEAELAPSVFTTSAFSNRLCSFCRIEISGPYEHPPRPHRGSVSVLQPPAPHPRIASRSHWAHEANKRGRNGETWRWTWFIPFLLHLLSATSCSIVQTLRQGSDPGPWMIAEWRHMCECPWSASRAGIQSSNSTAVNQLHVLETNTHRVEIMKFLLHQQDIKQRPGSRRRRLRGCSNACEPEQFLEVSVDRCRTCSDRNKLKRHVMKAMRKHWGNIEETLRTRVRHENTTISTQQVWGTKQTGTQNSIIARRDDRRDRLMKRAGDIRH